MTWGEEGGRSGAAYLPRVLPGAGASAWVSVVPPQPDAGWGEPREGHLQLKAGALGPAGYSSHRGEAVPSFLGGGRSGLGL